MDRQYCDQYQGAVIAGVAGAVVPAVVDVAMSGVVGTVMPGVADVAVSGVVDAVIAGMVADMTAQNRASIDKKPAE